MKITRFRALRRGFTLLEILIVVAILGLLVGLAIPNFMKSRNHAQKQICIENLSQIESAKQVWGLESGRTDGDAPVDADLFGANLYMKQKPRCVGGGEYRLNAIGTNASCEIEGHTL
jgi:prepilin-type N-terminal cleavage/methylation domain-containing protein